MDPDLDPFDDILPKPALTNGKQCLANQSTNGLFLALNKNWVV
jgi:hypothetical protein